jgi:diguanylate cyclase (GGDEF)-like protein/PAS domain S-box-containing protein
VWHSEGVRGKTFFYIFAVAGMVAMLLLGSILASLSPVRAFMVGSVFIALASFMVVKFLQSSVFSPLETLTEGVRQITQSGDAAKRIAPQGPSEYRQLGVSINSMLEALEQVKKDLEDSKTRYALAAAGANDGLWDWNLETKTVYFSPRWYSLLGYPEKREDTLEQWLSQVHPDDRERLESQLHSHLEGHSRFFESEHRILHHDGRHRLMLVRGKAIRNDFDQPMRMSGSLTDMSQRGLFDTLTGLPNRHLLMDRLGHALHRSSRESKRSALMVIDAHKFSLVNDSLGYYVGDLLLKELSQRLQNSVRLGDTVAHLGGDAFVLLLENISAEADIMLILERVQSQIALPFEVQGHQIAISANIGIVGDMGFYSNAEEALRNAEIAMYSARSNSQRYAFFESAMLSSIISRREIESELGAALNKQQFFLLYQPIVSLHSGQIQGFEALLRWQHPERGVVSPLHFIPIAEETGLIIPLGEWVLREACRQMAQWHKKHPGQGYMSVNLSAKQLGQLDLVKQVKTILHETGLAANYLKLEITESAIITDPKTALETLKQLKALGAHICMDDFGTGHSSLSYLHTLPLDTIKIDRSFISRLGSDQSSLAIVRAVTELARHMNLEVVSEGVELQEQADFLKGLECQYAQGYLFSKPISLEDMHKLHPHAQLQMQPS